MARRFCKGLEWHRNTLKALHHVYNKEVQEDGFVKVKYVKSLLNISDVTTKAVDRPTMKRLEPSATGYDLRFLNELMKLAYD